MNKDTVKAIRGLMIFAAILVLVVANIDKTVGILAMIIGILTPFLVGSALAFIINMPMKFVERKIFAKAKLNAKLKRVFSFLIALILVVSIVWAVYMLILPQLGETIKELAIKIPVFIKDSIAFLQETFENNPEIQEYIKNLDIAKWDWHSILTKIANTAYAGVSSMLVSTVNVASGIFGVVFDFIIALVFAIYLLFQKEIIKSQITRVFRAYLPEKVHMRIQYVSGLLFQNFSRFISSQCLEALILGLLFLIAMSIFGFPYAVLISTLIAVTALVPIVGAFVGCIVGAFLILVDTPIMAVYFVIMFLILQQIEGNLIYPKVVGNSVGLPAIWVLVAVSVGGSLFGVVGMLVFIPITSTLYTLLKEDVNERNSRK